MICECCGQKVPPKLSKEAYESRALPRLAKMEALEKRINFSDWTWRYTEDGKRWLALMEQQGRDEMDAGL